MEKGNNHQGSGFLNGFLWGFIIGGAVVFLLGTKKGKKLLRLITEEGLEGLGEIEEIVEEAKASDFDNEPLPDMDQVNNQKNYQEHVANGESNQKSHQNSQKEAHEKPQSSKPSFHRRFFRGIPKK